jgi:hypothetical protein
MEKIPWIAKVDAICNFVPCNLCKAFSDSWGWLAGTGNLFKDFLKL